MHRIVFYSPKEARKTELVRIEKYKYKVTDTFVSGRTQESIFTFKDYEEFVRMIPNMVCREGYKILEVVE